MKRIFVYGSLRKGMYNHERYLKGNSRFLSYGTLQGSLYALEGVDYPALLDGTDEILGEIYEVDDETAIKIDALEGCDKDELGEYRKELRRVKDAHGLLQLLPVYLYELTYQDNAKRLSTRIVSGDFVRYYQDVMKSQE